MILLRKMSDSDDLIYIASRLFKIECLKSVIDMYKLVILCSDKSKKMGRL